MSPGPRYSPPAPEVRQLTSREIEAGLLRLRKRIEAVKALQGASLQVGDQRVTSLEESIRTAILETFGPQSPQFRDHEYYEIWHGPRAMGMGDHEILAGVSGGLNDALHMLESLAAGLEEKQAELASDADAPFRERLGGMNLHPAIGAASLQQFRDGHYREAVLNAAIALNKHLQALSGRSDLDGVALAQTALSLKNPLLQVNDLVDESDRNEQVGMMHLLEGVFLAFRNPRAHRLTPDAAEAALEQISFIGFLAKRLDEARPAR